MAMVRGEMESRLQLSSILAMSGEFDRESMRKRWNANVLSRSSRGQLSDRADIFVGFGARAERTISSNGTHVIRLRSSDQRPVARRRGTRPILE